MSDTIFSKIIKREIPAEIVYETDEVLAFKDIAPQAPTHVIIIPKEPFTSLEDINENNYDITGKLILTASKIAKDLKLEGYRLVFNCNDLGGQTVYHLHCHLLGGRQMLWPPG